MAAEIRLFPCLTDNFGYLIHDPATKATASIDAPEAGPIIKALEREGWTLTDILITHHHHDHVGGVAELKQKYNCRVVAPHDKAAKIADVDLRAAQGDVVKVGSLLARVLETPGHTLDHISYVFDSEKALFAADTLFSIGCGRVFEGTYPMMWDSLLKLRALPDDFKLYCGHEYTASNVKFALTVEPDNAGAEGARRGSDAAARRRQADHSGRCSATRRRPTCSCAPTIPSVAASVRMKGAERRRSVRRIARAQEQVLMAMAPTAAEIIARLDLKPHPEGGHYRETFRDPRAMPRARVLHRDLFPAGARRTLALAPRRCGRGLALLRRRRADACRSPMMTAQRSITARPRPRGRRTAAGDRAAACLAGGGEHGDWTLVGCTVAPGFDFAKFRTGAERLGAGLTLQVERFQIISFAAIRPPPAISTAAMAMVALGLAKPARIRNAVESSGVA